MHTFLHVAWVAIEVLAVIAVIAGVAVIALVVALTSGGGNPFE